MMRHLGASLAKGFHCLGLFSGLRYGKGVYRVVSFPFHRYPTDYQLFELRKAVIKPFNIVGSNLFAGGKDDILLAAAIDMDVAFGVNGAQIS